MNDLLGLLAELSRISDAIASPRDGSGDTLANFGEIMRLSDRAARYSALISRKPPVFGRSLTLADLQKAHQDLAEQLAPACERLRARRIGTETLYPENPAVLLALMLAIAELSGAEIPPHKPHTDAATLHGNN